MWVVSQLVEHLIAPLSLVGFNSRAACPTYVEASPHPFSHQHTNHPADVYRLVKKKKWRFQCAI